MIKETSMRMAGDRPEYEPVVKQLSVPDALQSLIIYELGYGGKVVSITPTEVCISTSIMGCVDKTIYEGTPVDMALLLEASVLSLRIDPEAAAANRVYRNALEESLIRTAQGSPFVLKFGRGILSGSVYIKAILMTMLNLVEGDVKQLDKCSADDLLSALVLLRIDHQHEEVVRYVLGLNAKTLVKKTSSKYVPRKPVPMPSPKTFTMSPGPWSQLLGNAADFKIVQPDEDTRSGVESQF